MLRHSGLILPYCAEALDMVPNATASKAAVTSQYLISVSPKPSQGFTLAGGSPWDESRSR